MYEKLFFGSSKSTYQYSRQLKSKPTKAEKALWEQLRNRKIKNCKFRRQHPIKNYIVDFYCLEKSLVIEVDGEIHLKKENIEYDQARTMFLESIGLKVIRFSNKEIELQLYEVLRKIEVELG